MRSAILCLLILMLPAAVLAGSGTLAGGTKPQVGGRLANFTLPAPEDPEHLAYLGISREAAEFRLNKIKAKTLLIEVFSMYCPFCQKEAPAVNELYAKLRQSPLKDELKMLGLGTGNSAYEVGVFRDKFSVTMPLFADENFSIYETIGRVGTPFFILARIEPGAEDLEILLVQEGVFGDPEAFYNQVLELAGQ